MVQQTPAGHRDKMVESSTEAASLLDYHSLEPSVLCNKQDHNLTFLTVACNSESWEWGVQGLICWGGGGGEWADDPWGLSRFTCSLVGTNFIYLFIQTWGTIIFRQIVNFAKFSIHKQKFLKVLSWYIACSSPCVKLFSSCTLSTWIWHRTVWAARTHGQAAPRRRGRWATASGHPRSQQLTRDEWYQPGSDQSHLARVGKFLKNWK